MPLFKNMDFVQHGLHVRYRSDARPQKVFLDISTTGLADQPLAEGFVLSLGDTVAHGGGGSDLFPPTAGYLRKLGPPPKQRMRGPDYHFELEVAGVAPVFVRHAIQALRSVGFDQLVTSLSWVGELPLDDGPMSVTEVEMKRWLDDPDVFIRMWPKPPFPIVRRGTTKGATVRLELGKKPNKDEAFELEERLQNYLVECEQLVDADGRQVDPESYPPPEEIWKFARGKTEVVARASHFPWRRDAGYELLVNYLCNLHETVVPILEAEIAL